MDDFDFERTENPFSAWAEERASSRRQFVSTAKFLVAIVVLFCAVTAGQSYLQKTRLSNLLSGFAQGGEQNKLKRLGDLREAGIEGLPGLVAALDDSEAEVAATAAELVLESNRAWMTLSESERSQCRLLCASELEKVADRIANVSDPRWIRVEFLARTLAQDMLGSQLAAETEAYRRLMGVIAKGDFPNAREYEQQAATSDPLPLGLVGGADAAWTQWPPASSTQSTTTPSIVGRQVASVDTMRDRRVVLQQADPAVGRQHEEPRLLRPRVLPSATLAEQSTRENRGQIRSTGDWILQLASQSRLVRMHAVAELGRRNETAAIDALERHLKSEPDTEIVRRIELLLSR